MTLLRLKDIRDMSSEQRTERVNELRTELARLKTMVAAGGSIDNPSQIHEMRKTIARILTVEAEEKRKNEKK
jgi:large subunit ribosomal protein L29